MIRSFGYAFDGVKAAARSEQNLRFHLIAASVVLLLSFLLRISAIQFAIVIICIGFVIAAELLNTAIEKLSDIVLPEYNEKIKVIKDLSAAAVLVVSIIALIIGCIIFIPKVAGWVSQL